MPLSRALISLLASASILGGCADARRVPVGEPAAAREVLEEPTITAGGLQEPAITEGVEEEERPPSLAALAEVRRVPAFDRPGAPEPFTTFENPGPFHSRRVFLVRRTKGRWLQVYLPMRPNGSTGWIRRGTVDLVPHDYRVTIRLGEHLLVVRKGDEVVMREQVAVGTGGTPTPTGLFYTTVLVAPADPGGAYGPYAYGLSGYSEVLTTFAGGDGQIAIHGTNNPASIGVDASHGCIRMSNEAITELSTYLPLGTPVRIRP
jgi:hypothetical protein